MAIGLVVKAPLIVAFALNRCDTDFCDTELAVVALEQRRPERVVAELARLGLTEREAEIIHQLMHGEPVRAAASNLGIAVATLNKHLEHAYRKLGVTSRSGAVAAASDALFGIR